MTKLIVLEGIDCCGKTTLSKMISDDLNIVRYADLKNKWYPEHEPNFSSKEADKLNSPGINPWQREFYFLKDRIKHQTVLNLMNIVLDRYILTGLAYAQTFSPEVIPMIKSIYFLPDEFKRPDVIIFIDIDIDDALIFNELKKGTKDYSTNINRHSLKTLQTNFKLHFNTMREWEIPVLSIKPTIGNLIETKNAILDKIQYYL